MLEFENKYMMSYKVVDNIGMRENYVIFVSGNKAGADTVLNIIEYTQRFNQEYKKYYDIVYNKDFSNRQKMDEIEKEYEYRGYEEKFFMCSPTHALGSDYEAMSKEDSDKFLDDMKITKYQVKTISRNEHIIKYFWVSKGTILRVFGILLLVDHLSKKLSTLDMLSN